MKLLASLVLSFAGFALAADKSAEAASSDYWAGVDPTEVAQPGCAKPTAFFECFKVVSKYAYCDASDDACNCSSVMVDKNCFNKHCGTSEVFDSRDSTLYCTGTATKGMKDVAEQTPSPSAPASADASPTPTPTPTAAPAGSSPSGSAASSSPNAGDRSMRVSSGGLIAVAAAAVGSFLYRL
ncbi:hypothetical protein MMC07_009093 [Pseudocyphellaria aurata]|nr:hypothetical protein [Pseudocyphellaria aurata]